MALTNSNLSTYLLKALHNDGDISAADSYVYLNLGRDRIVSDHPSGLGIKIGTVTTADGSQAYSLASDFYRMVRVYVPAYDQVVDPMSRQEFAEEVECQDDQLEGYPRRYCIYGWDVSEAAWQIKFDYESDAAYTVRYYYYWKPADMAADSTIPALSEMGFAQLLISAATVCAREINNPLRLPEALAQYETDLKRYREHTQSAEYYPVLRGMSEKEAGPTLRLTDHFPRM